MEEVNQRIQRTKDDIGSLSHAGERNACLSDMQPTEIDGRPSDEHNLRKNYLYQVDESGNLWAVEYAVMKLRTLSINSEKTSPLLDEIDDLWDELFNQCRLTKNQAILQEAISMLRALLNLYPVNHPKRDSPLRHLGSFLLNSFLQFGGPDNLHEAVLHLKEALRLCPSPHANRAKSLDCLAHALMSSYRLLGDADDLKESITLSRDAIALRSDLDPDCSTSLNNLGVGLWVRYESSGEVGDLEEAAEFHRKALLLRPFPHPFRSQTINNLAIALFVIFRHSGKQEHLDEAIVLHRETLIEIPKKHPSRCNNLNNIALTLRARYELTHDQEDLDEAINLHGECLSLVEAPFPERCGFMNNFAMALMLRYEKLKLPEDLDKAIIYYRESASLRPAPNPRRWSTLQNLSVALRTRYKELGENEDLNDIISLQRECLSLCPPGHSGRPQILVEFGSTLLTRFKLTNMDDDLEEAIQLQQESIGILGPGHTFFSSYSSELAMSLLHAYNCKKAEVYLSRSMDTFRVASKSLSSPVVERLQVSRLWASCAESSGHYSALEAYEESINLLPRLSSLGYHLDKRQEAFRAVDGLARSAAICAIRSGNFEKAIELLEAGRAVFWLQALQLRTPFDDLREISPVLASDISRIASQIEEGLHREIRKDGGNEQRVSFEKDISNFNSLNKKWETAMEAVRQLDGFQEFLQPSKISRLQMAASKMTPIVLLIPGDSDSHALIMNGVKVEHLLLPAIGINVLRTLVSKIRYFTPKGRRGDHGEISCSRNTRLNEEVAALDNTTQNRLGRPAKVNPEEEFAAVLKTLWEEVVAPIIRYLKLVKNETPPIIRWCPTGVFSFLPLHAAGIYKSDMSSIDSAPDYIISSYTPTIGTLILSQPPKPSPENQFRMLVVIEPKTLPSTTAELHNIEKYIPSDLLIKLGIPGSPASLETVLAHLSSASIVHFACHGKQYDGTPLESALLLEDGELKISKIMKHRMPNASLAFLCACETAMGDENTPDETIHLSAALLFSGFRGVIATMWSIEDADGPMVADEFYKYIYRNGDGASIAPDTTEAARAIHHATTNLRSQGISFRRWVPFIHMGN